MKEHGYQIIGLIGFIVAGVLFVIVGWRANDMLTVSASLIWTASCFVWMIPLLRAAPGVETSIPPSSD